MTTNVVGPLSVTFHSYSNISSVVFHVSSFSLFFFSIVIGSVRNPLSTLVTGSRRRSSWERSV